MNTTEIFLIAMRSSFARLDRDLARKFFAAIPPAFCFRPVFSVRYILITLQLHPPVRQRLDVNKIYRTENTGQKKKTEFGRS